MTADNISFETLSIELSPKLRKYLERMVGNPADADDLLQETMMRIAKGLETFEGRSSAKNWAYRIATHVAIDHLRKDKFAVFEPVDSDITYVSCGDDERLILDEMNACIRDVISGLPPDYRAVIILFNLHGKSVQEYTLFGDPSLKIGGYS